MTHITRRHLMAYTGATLATATVRCALAATPLFRAIGITATIDRASQLKLLGADFIVESVADFLVPFSPESEFATNASRAKAASLPIRGCNSFMRHPSLVCVGPKADHPRVFAYCETAFRRLQSIGGEYIVFGSNSARHIPDGWSKPNADAQFIALLRQMGALAQRHGITVAVESLNSRECNYLNHLPEVVSVVKEVDSPNIRVLADLYHMRVMGDTPEQLADAMPWVGLVEVAEREQRTVPGVAGDDFTPFFKVVARHGYRGLIDIEANGNDDQLRKAFVTVAEQAARALREAATGVRRWRAGNPL